MDNSLLHIMGREIGQTDSERQWNVFIQLSFFLFFLSPHTECGIRKVSTIIEGIKCCAPVVKIDSVISKNTHLVLVSGNVFYPLPIP